MSGWEKVIAATLVAVIGLIALNLAVWRRLRVATRDGVVSTSDARPEDDDD